MSHAMSRHPATASPSRQTTDPPLPLALCPPPTLSSSASSILSMSNSSTRYSCSTCTIVRWVRYSVRYTVSTTRGAAAEVRRVRHRVRVVHWVSKRRHCTAAAAHSQPHCHRQPCAHTHTPPHTHLHPDTRSSHTTNRAAYQPPPPPFTQHTHSTQPSHLGRQLLLVQLRLLQLNEAYRVPLNWCQGCLQLGQRVAAAGAAC